MNKKNGFTLIEILAVVTIIGLIFILVLPKITNSLKNKKGDVDRTTTNLVLSATKLYVSDHSSKFEKTDGNISCMPLHQLVREGYLEGPVKNVTDDKDITNGKSVRITYDKGFKYEIVNKQECKVYYCKYDFCDNDGNGYTEVEYLESTGTQYIDTGVKLPFTVEVKVKYTSYAVVDSSDKNSTILGNQNKSSPWNSTYIRYQGYASPQNFECKCSNNYVKEGIQSDLNIHTFKLTCFKNNGVLYMDDNLEGSITSTGDLISRNIYLFATNSSENAIHNMSGRIYYVKFYSDADGTVLAHSFIPVIDSTERPCMFDKITKVCHYNQGTGEFLWG